MSGSFSDTWSADGTTLATRLHVNSIAEKRSFTALSVERPGDRIVIGGEAWIVGETIQTENRSST